ncbi:MAG: hypothetical protein ISF22_09515 [Methanomassiliicoccus sp.]|nr:hypothetical protein [Methanomassiliicoccus sp.]
MSDGVLAWAIADAADERGMSDLRDEMVVEALRSGEIDDARSSHHLEWSEAAVARMSRRDLETLAGQARVPSECVPWMLKLLAGRSPELGARFFDRLPLKYEAFLSCLAELGNFGECLAVRSGERYAIGLLRSSRHYHEVMQVLRAIKAFSGLEGDDWSSYLRELLGGYRGRKRLWEMIGEEGW